MELFHLIGTWFGYVGACVASPDATCRPLMAFIALGAAASAALTLVLLAYANVQRRESAQLEDERTKAQASKAQERVRRSLAERAAVKPLVSGRLRAAT